VLTAASVQQRRIQRVAWAFGTGMGVHVNQAGHEPAAIDHRLCRGQGLQRDPVASHVQVAFLVVRQDDAAQVQGHAAHPQ
jgi:hypothetical protein